MYIDLELLPADARASVYPSQKQISAWAANTLSKDLSTFLCAWNTHGQPLQASLHVGIYEIVLFVDISTGVMPSGCALDRWHRKLQEVCNQLDIDCFNYHQLLFQGEDGRLQLFDTNEARMAWKTGMLSAKSLMANPQVQTKGAFFGAERWLPLAESWFARRHL